MSTVIGRPPAESGVQHSELARQGADNAEKVTRLPVAHQATKDAIEAARAEAQYRVQQEVAEFLKTTHGAGAPVDVIIVFRNPDGSMGYSAPEGDGLAQVGMMDCAKAVLINKMLGVLS